MHVRFALAASTLLGAAVTAAYCLGFLFVAYGLTAGDYAPGREPPQWQLDLTWWAVWAGGIGLYAALAWAWCRLNAWIAGRHG